MHAAWLVVKAIWAISSCLLVRVGLLLVPGMVPLLLVGRVALVRLGWPVGMAGCRALKTHIIQIEPQRQTRVLLARSKQQSCINAGRRVMTCQPVSIQGRGVGETH